MAPQELGKEVDSNVQYLASQIPPPLTSSSVYIHWEYNSQHVTCQELEKILYSQMISHYLSYRALKCEDGNKKSNWGSMKNTLPHREGMLPWQLRKR